MLNFVYYPVSGLLWFWHKVFGYVLGPSNGLAWALSVTFLVFTLRALLFKPFVSQVRSMRRMQEFAPQIQKLKEKYGNDRQRMAQEMQKLQAEHGVNPLGGCLPMLVQIPVFIGLFHVLRLFEPGRGEIYFLGAKEIQSFIDAKLFGTPLSAFMTMPQHLLDKLGGERLSVILVGVPLTIAAGIATHLTARHSVQRQTAAAAANPQTAMMNKLTLYLFPLGVVAGGPFFPIAILIYWLSNNIWTLGQQYVVYHKIDREEEEKKATATTQRQSLAPKPGQKPVRPKKGATQAKPAATDSEKAQSNGQAPDSKARQDTPADSADAKPGEIPGLTEDRSRGKKQGRKRR